MKKCDLTWSILSTEIDYTTNKDNSPLGSYMAKDEPRTFPVDNHIPFDGRGMSKAYWNSYEIVL